MSSALVSGIKAFLRMETFMISLVLNYHYLNFYFWYDSLKNSYSVNGNF